MAEERLIDEDKDRKYRIVKNEDGEDVLVINETPEEEEAPVDEQLYYNAEESGSAAVEETVMTPDELAERRDLIEEQNKEREKKLAEYIDGATEDCAKERYATALEKLQQVEKVDPSNGELYALRTVAYTRNFSDYSQIEKAAESAEGVTRFTSPERKKALLSRAGNSLEKNISSIRSRVNSLNSENEERRALRAKKFVKDRNIALLCFMLFFAMAAAFSPCAVWFYTRISTVPTNEYTVKAIAFGVMGFIGLLGFVVSARFFATTQHRVSQNNRNTSTQLGRELIAEQAKLKAFTDVYNALNS